MEYIAAEDKAEFTGDVKLTSGTDQAHGDRMQVLFAPSSPTAPTEPAEPIGDGDLVIAEEPAATDGAYANQDVTKIKIDGNVTLIMVRNDPQGHLVRRLFLKGESFDVDIVEKLVNGHDAGSLSVEDYRQPESAQSSASGGAIGSGGVRRPNQTAFDWTDVMSLSQATGEVILSGEVKMVHCSGKYLKLTEGERVALNVPDWPELDFGRITKIRCDRMSAVFDQPASRQRSENDDANGDSAIIGDLKSFYASGDVRVVDGERQKRTIDCQHLRYNRLEDIVKILGRQVGGESTKATMYFEDLDTGDSKRWSYNAMTWYRRNDKVVADDVTGGGVR